MSACGEAHNDRKTATGNITATGAPVARFTHHAVTTPASEQIAASGRYAAGTPGRSSAKNAFGFTTFHIPNSAKPALARSVSTNAREPSGTAIHDTAASMHPVTNTPSHARKYCRG